MINPKDINVEFLVYQRVCVQCPHERTCHINCTTCDEFEELLMELEEELLNDVGE